MVRATLSGRAVDTLVDTGATISAVSPLIARECVDAGCEKVACADPIRVQLANSSYVQVNECLKAKFCLADRTTEVQLYIMNLPPGYDVLIGMDWLQMHDAWLSPKRKRIVLPTQGAPEGLHIAVCDAKGGISPRAIPRVPGQKRMLGVYALQQVPVDTAQSESQTIHYESIDGTKI